MNKGSYDMDTGNRNGTFGLVLTGLVAALVFAATSFFKIPTIATQGYVHLGDAVVLIGVIILGRARGSLAAAMGSAMSDIIGGYVYWAPWTFLIKGMMALIFSLASGRDDQIELRAEKPASLARAIFAGAASGAFMVLGYYLAASIMYGNMLTPLSSVPWNIAQAVSACLISAVFSSWRGSRKS